MKFYFSIIAFFCFTFGQTLEGEEAPTFWLQDLNNNDYFFSKRDEGKPLYINFFATWCSPCLLELREISELEETYSDSIDFLIIDVSSSASTAKPITPLSISDLVIQYDIKSKVLIDKYAVVAEKFKIQTLPTNIFINKKNLIVKDIRKKIDKSSFIANLEYLRF